MSQAYFLQTRRYYSKPQMQIKERKITFAAEFSQKNGAFFA